MFKTSLWSETQELFKFIGAIADILHYYPPATRSVKFRPMVRIRKFLVPIPFRLIPSGVIPISTLSLISLIEIWKTSCWSESLFTIWNPQLYLHTFSAFWLWSSVVSVLISVKTDMSASQTNLFTKFFAGVCVCELAHGRTCVAAVLHSSRLWRTLSQTLDRKTSCRSEPNWKLPAWGHKASCKLDWLKKTKAPASDLKASCRTERKWLS